MLVVDAIGGAADTLPPILRNNPLLAVLVAGLALAAIVAGVVALLRYRRTAGQRFKQALAPLDSLAVLMHPDPDPDAMASALAAMEVAESVDTAATIYYSGQIRRPENRAFRTVIEAGVEFERVEHARALASEAVVLVDHNEPRGFNRAESIEPYAVVDHHPGDGTGTAFTDVRTDSGACASIFTEYLEDLGWQPYDGDSETRPEKPLSAELSTGLLYGILSDTNYFSTGCSDADLESAVSLYSAVNGDLLERIANPQVDPEILDVKSRAISNREVRNAFAVSDVGTVSNGDAVPEAADELLRLEGVTALVVVADKDGTLRMSGRSTDDRVHMGNALEAAVDDVPMGSAGGHSRMGGGNVSLAHLNGGDTGELITGADGGTELTRERFKERLFDAMRGDI
ncbi:MAG: DHHA1 domain-containing protein [Halovenus sp.]